VKTIAEPREAKVNTTFKAEVTYLGEDKLKLCELLVVALQLNESVLRALTEKVPCLLVKLFKEYPWNSSFHKAFESFVSTVMDSSNDAL
jgi:hypothetical protein